MQQRPTRPGLVMAGAGGDQAVRGTGGVDALRPVADDGDVFLDPREHDGVGPLVRGLDRLSHLLISERPHQLQGRLRPKDEIGFGDLHLAPECPGLARGRGLLPRCQLLGYEPVGVRVPAFAEQGAQLRLGHLLTKRETDGGGEGPAPSICRPELRRPAAPFEWFAVGRRPSPTRTWRRK
ncbi:hypothetical protein GCM10010320_71870 [Streptomyces caelestis]|nr:hypothetical protein GCM10010320_71870 [Streptomyces caelestis]